jgi:Ribonuclease G/E
MIPYLCPVCRGCGNVPGGFYNCTYGHITEWVSASAMEQCRSCKGKGIIWESESSIVVMEEK